ncbi:sulfotransferase [Pleurocapsa sp. PCC 7319]|uniref:sulfotransferase family protein n=1 Tax=Pleurocapsa sp. PCC 7319 TaxID=118161 RepID=UPI000349582D|nr:sulfotransferase [Pleurocapsa sp. PCC 7319]
MKDISSNSQLRSSSVKSIVETLKKLRRRMMKKAWSEPVNEITWYNLPWWIYQTAKTDFRHYCHQKRSLTTERIKGFVQPNLQAPIFIIGSPRSGTTFLGECLGTIPEISYHFEPVLIKAAARYVFTQEWELKQASNFYRQVYSWLMRFQGDGDLRLADKTPRNSFIIPFLAQTFPNAKFVHIIRDGRDVALSLSKKPWYNNKFNGSIMREPGGYLCGSTPRFWVESDRHHEFATTDNIHRCIWLWRRYIEAATEGLNSLSSAQKYELKYEDLIAHPDREGTRLLDFLDITTDDSRSIFQEYLTSQARLDSIGRWQSNLDAEDIVQIKQEALTWLEQYNYKF